MAMDPNAGPGLPPELMAALASAGAGGGPAPVPANPAAPAGADPSDAPGGTNLQSLQDAITAAQSYVDGEDDEVHKQTALQCIAKLQSILADEQKGADNLLQGKADPRALRRASGPAY